MSKSFHTARGLLRNTPEVTLPYNQPPVTGYFEKAFIEKYGVNRPKCAGSAFLYQDILCRTGRARGDLYRRNDYRAGSSMGSLPPSLSVSCSFVNHSADRYSLA
jgi:hypothetical protein